MSDVHFRISQTIRDVDFLTGPDVYVTVLIFCLSVRVSRDKSIHFLDKTSHFCLIFFKFLITVIYIKAPFSKIQVNIHRFRVRKYAVLTRLLAT